MAFNWKTFQTRTITSIIFAGVMLVGLFWNQWSFFILFSIIHFGCWAEYQKLVSIIDPGYKNMNPIHRFSIPFLGWTFMLLLAWVDPVMPEMTPDVDVILFVVFGIFILGELIYIRRFRLKNLAHSL